MGQIESFYLLSKFSMKCGLMTHSFCPYFNQNQCRSCTWIELPYEAQIQRKEQVIKERLGFLGSFTLENSTRSSEKAFRNRVKMVVTGTSENPIIGLTGLTNRPGLLDLLGATAESHLDQGRELLACPIHHVKINEVIALLPDFIKRFNLIPYRISERRGELKGLIFFYSQQTDEMYLRFVLRSKECVSRILKMLPELQSKVPQLVCVSANIQPIPHAILEGTEEIILTEKKVVAHQIGAVQLNLAPSAFVQTNSEVAVQLYETAAKWIGETRSRKMIELYCGQGAFSFLAAARASYLMQCLGFDINSEAVRAANETAENLGLKNLRFECADASRGIELIDKIRDTNPDLILVNPPRKGLGSGVVMLKSSLPKTLIYSSCSIESLAKDLKELASHYRLKRAQLFDLFPHTEHFETLVELESSGNASMARI